MDKFLVIYGQEDYVARLEAYLRSWSVEIRKISFPLLGDKPGSLEIDFAVHDNDLLGLDRGTKIIIAFATRYHQMAKEHLARLGFTDLVLYDAYLDNRLKKDFFQSMYAEQGREFITVDELLRGGFLEIYMARSNVDKGKPPEKFLGSPYIIPIQVGAALTDDRIADVLDSTGDNISERNRHYSEMTAFYWMWKNAKAEYLGVCHYRRFWENIERIAVVLHMGNVDAILPLPTYCEHSVYEDYLIRHIPTVWKPMMEVMQKRSPEYYEAAKDIFQGKIFYASNMCILRREVLDDLCDWMFPIVMEVEELVGDIDEPYYNRYAGFCTERLITLYFLYNKHHWKIAHAEKVFVG